MSVGNYTQAIVGNEYLILLSSVNTQPTFSYVQGATLVETLESGSLWQVFKVKATATTIGTNGNFYLTVVELR